MPRGIPEVSIPGDPGRSCKASNAPALKVTHHLFCPVVWASSGSRVEDYTGREDQEARSIGATPIQRSPELRERLDQRHKFGHQ